MRGRIRTIKPEIGKSEELWDLGQSTGFPVYQAFTLLWCYADREGRFEWRPRALKTDILPYWDGDFSRVLDALATRGFIVKYTVAGRDYGLIPTFTKHQVINNRETDSGLPFPAAPEPIYPETTRDARVEHASSTPLNLVQVEGKGRELEGNGDWKDASRDAVLPASVPETFDLPIDEPPKTQRDLQVPRRPAEPALAAFAPRESSPPPQVAPRVAQAPQSNSPELQAGWRPRNRQECAAAPIAQRAEWAMRELHWAAEYSPQMWPEVVQVAQAFHVAYKLAPPKLGPLNSDRHGTQRIVSLLTQYTPEQLVKVCAALPKEKFSLDRIGAGERPRLGWLSDEVVRTAFGALPSERPMSERVRRAVAGLEPMRETGS